MTRGELVEQFTAAAAGVGAEVRSCADLGQALAHVAKNAGGTLALPAFASGDRLELAARLREAGVAVADRELRQAAADAAAGLTGANFALAATGTVVLESTPEDIRLATTLPERHFVLLDPAKILADEVAAVPLLREFHQRRPRNYLAYITGPSRTADIERVLTIGVHGPRELHVLLVPGFSEDFLEM